ncbi:MAG: DUF58 domain-containing protein [Nitrospiraceae bacterium]|nr:DUF58 domain-containing protein [Nitrospiraceae bacterium]
MDIPFNTFSFNELINIITKNVVKLIDIFKLKLVYFKIITGKGMEFDRLRKYTESDDSSSIDWNATARTTIPYVKVFKEERMLDVVLAVDVSNTMMLGTTGLTKNEYASVVAGIIGYTALSSGDRLGALLFSDHVKRVIEPFSMMDDYYALIKHLTDAKNYGGVKNLNCIKKIMLQTYGPDTVLFIISDFIGANSIFFDNVHYFTNKFKAVFGVMIRDLRDYELPKGVGSMYLADPDSGRISLVHVDKVRKQFNESAKLEEKHIEVAFKKAGAFFIKIPTNKSFVNNFAKFIESVDFGTSFG